MLKSEGLFDLTQGKLKNGLREIAWKREIYREKFMCTLEKQRIVSVKDPGRLGTKVNRRKEALRKLAEYLRNERGYSENEIRKFMAKSFIGKVEY